MDELLHTGGIAASIVASGLTLRQLTIMIVAVVSMFLSEERRKHALAILRVLKAGDRWMALPSHAPTKRNPRSKALRRTGPSAT